MSWFILTLSGLLEAVIPILIIKSKNYTDLVYTSVLGVVVIASVMGLRFATGSIPLAVAYIVWTALGIMGTVLVGVVLLNETLSLFKIACVLVMIVAVAGLRLSSIEDAVADNEPQG